MLTLEVPSMDDGSLQRVVKSTTPMAFWTGRDPENGTNEQSVFVCLFVGWDWCVVVMKPKR
jgi:hypothetical protein